MSSTRTGGPCPKCHGTGRLDEFGIGLVVVCDACAGALAERQTGPKDQPDSPVWRHPAVSNLDTCRVCLGTGVVVNLGGTGEPTGAVVELPCPACSRGSDPL
jgi:DnaJ-class molecular chaperone